MASFLANCPNFLEIESYGSLVLVHILATSTFIPSSWLISPVFFVSASFLNSPTDMVVDARAVPGARDGTVTCPVTGPSGKPCPSHVEPVGDGTFKATYTPTEPGKGGGRMFWADGVMC